MQRIMGGSHGFQGERTGEQSSPTEYKGGEDCRKLTANEMPLRGIIGYY